MSDKNMDVMRVRVTFGKDKPGDLEFRRAYGISTTIGRGESKGYDYRVLRGLDVKKGDFVVVETPHHGLTVVTVAEDPTEEAGLNTASLKWVIDKVDMASYKEMMERAERKRVLTARLDTLANEARKRIDYAALFANNEDAMALLKELESLG